MLMRIAWGVLLLTALAACQAEAPPPEAAPPAGPPRTGELRSYATLHSVGFEWRFSSDPNGNAACTLRYREAGGAWQQAWPPYRIRYEPPSPVAGKTEPFDGCAGSVFFLEPGREYQLWLELEDPDGPDDGGVITVHTLTDPSIPEDARAYYVEPGSGGGAGTPADPFRGIEEAQRHARPGDVFWLAPGEYAAFADGEILFDAAGAEGRWVVWKAAGDGVVFTAPVRVAASYVWLEGVHVRGDPADPEDWGLRTYNAPERVVIQRNTFTDFYYSIALNHGGSAWVIRDNVIAGDKDLYTCWDAAAGEETSGGGCPEASWAGEGIELNHTPGHTVAHNRISLVADGISYPLANVDIFGNDIFNVTDDGIEADYGYANIRVWGNRISNARHNGLSFQPMNGGPWYFIRNQVAAPLESSLKLRRLSRVLLAHNLLVGWENAVTATYDTEGFRRIDSLNNVYLSVAGRYVWEQYDDGPAEARLDYDAFDWGDAAMAFKWGADRRFPDLAGFQQATGLEPHGLAFERAACLENLTAVATRPPDPASPAPVTLKPGCPLVDAGLALPNLTGAYAGSAPDLGPHELGLPLPVYGPR